MKNLKTFLWTLVIITGIIASLGAAWHGIQALDALVTTNGQMMRWSGTLGRLATWSCVYSDDDGTITIPAGETLLVGDSPLGSIYGVIKFSFNGDGSAVTTGTYWDASVPLPYDVTLTNWDMCGTESGTAQLGLARATKDEWAVFIATSILGAQTAAITASTVAQDLNIADWGETQLSANTYLVPSVTAATETGLVWSIWYTRR